MILSRLRLENFKRYVTFKIEFGEGLIGIIGKNGSGKSTIFEAILFALYGELKNKKFKEVIRNANASTKDVVLVELVFEFEAAEYRVVREFRGKALSANAKLYKNEELTTSGVKEVTSAITKLTKMSKDAFLHTLFASQKELTSLSTLKNEDRKKMIRKLLGLEKIDFIENSLVLKSRELKNEIKAFAEVLLSEDELRCKKDSKKENTQIKKHLEKELNIQEKELEKTKKDEDKVKKDLEKFAKIKELKQKLENEIQIIENSIKSNTKTQEKLKTELEKLEIKAKELKELSGVKKEYEDLQTELKNQENLKNIQIKKEGLEKEQTQLREQYTKSKVDIKTLEIQCQEHDKLQKKIEEKETQYKKQKEELLKTEETQKQIHSKLSAEERVVTDTKQKIAGIEELGRESNCPTCTRQLLDEYDHVLSSLSLIVETTQSKKIEKLKEQLKVIKLENDKLQKQTDELQITLHVDKSALSVVQSKQKDLLSAQKHFKEVSQKGVENKQELEKLSKYSYDEALHVKTQKSFDALKFKYEKAQSLEIELKRVKNLEEDLSLAFRSEKSLHVEAKIKQNELNKTNYDVQKHKNTQSKYEELQKQKETRYLDISTTKQSIAKVEGEIKILQNSLENNEAQLKKVQTKRDDLADYDKIKTSLSQFKTRLNEKVAPRISQIASQMYATITKGRYQHIEVSNDFDFFIYDEGKRYPIERFSGGEVDLANLVLRIAISKTLSELSGANSIGFLAFDEVFGSQDETRRMEILEAFHTIKEQYRQIFLISHEMEIREMFERVVEI